MSKLLAVFDAMTIEQKRRYLNRIHASKQWCETPVDLPQFISSPVYLGHPKLSKLQFELVEAGAELFDISIANNERRAVLSTGITECIVQWGKGSGKDTCAAIIVARVLYLLSCLTNPQGFFGMPNYSSIDMLNMACTEDQAAVNFFAPLKRMIVQSPWFTQRLGVKISSSAIHAPPIIGKDETGLDMYAINAWSGGSSHESYEGKNLILGILDEIDAFRQPVGTIKNPQAVTAESMYESVSSSVQSRFPGIGKTILLSWPRYHGSFIMKKAESGREDAGIYVSGPHATWEVNPTKSESDFADAFRRNPELAKKMYLAQPGAAIDRYFTNEIAVLTVFNSQRTVSFDITQDDDNPGRQPPVDYTDMRIKYMLPPDRSANYCWHIDLALRQCRAAAAMAHHSGYVPGANGEFVPVVSLDLVYWWEAQAGAEIDFTEVRRLVLSMARAGYRTRLVTYDGYQSTDSLQILRRHDSFGNAMTYNRDGKPVREPIEAINFSLDTTTRGYDTLKELIYEPGRLDAFYCPILVEELLNLVMVNGKKIDHPSGGSKDLADAVAGAVFGALQNLSSKPPGELSHYDPRAAIVGVQRADDNKSHNPIGKDIIPRAMIGR